MLPAVVVMVMDLGSGSISVTFHPGVTTSTSPWLHVLPSANHLPHCYHGWEMQL